VAAVQTEVAGCTARVDELESQVAALTMALQQLVAAAAFSSTEAATGAVTTTSTVGDGLTATDASAATSVVAGATEVSSSSTTTAATITTGTSIGVVDCIADGGGDGALGNNEHPCAEESTEEVTAPTTSTGSAAAGGGGSGSGSGGTTTTVNSTTTTTTSVDSGAVTTTANSAATTVAGDNEDHHDADGDSSNDGNDDLGPTTELHIVFSAADLIPGSYDGTATDAELLAALCDTTFAGACTTATNTSTNGCGVASMSLGTSGGVTLQVKRQYEVSTVFQVLAGEPLAYCIDAAPLASDLLDVVQAAQVCNAVADNAAAAGVPRAAIEPEESSCASDGSGGGGCKVVAVTAELSPGFAAVVVATGSSDSDSSDSDSNSCVVASGGSVSVWQTVMDASNLTAVVEAIGVVVVHACVPLGGTAASLSADAAAALLVVGSPSVTVGDVALVLVVALPEVALQAASASGGPSSLNFTALNLAESLGAVAEIVSAYDASRAATTTTTAAMGAPGGVGGGVEPWVVGVVAGVDLLVVGGIVAAVVVTTEQAKEAGGRQHRRSRSRHRHQRQQRQHKGGGDEEGGAREQSDGVGRAG
jgi:hypothetical protein